MQKKRNTGKKKDIRSLLKLYAYMRPYRGKFIAGMVCLLVSSITMLGFPKLMGNMVDIGTMGKGSVLLTQAGLLLILVLVVQAVFGYYRTLLFVEVTEKTLASLRQSTYNHIIKLPMHFFSKRRVGELNSRISLDSESERLVQDALDKLTAGRASLIITHRLSTIRKTDKIIVLDEGRVVEEGSHTELLLADGLYRSLSEMQFAV